MTATPANNDGAHDNASPAERTLWFASALLADGWARDVEIGIAAGRITAIRKNVPDSRAERQAGVALPGMINLHSHAFQRAMAGMTEYRANASDSFWTWRELMYRFAAQLTPELLQAIASWLYVEMLKAGYTRVCEFHYLHHDTNGRPHADPAELSWRIFAAADASGIGLTHLPVLYRHGGFGPLPAKPGQQRFLHDIDAYGELLARLHKRCDNDARVLGIAPHSLRAVTAADLQQALGAINALNPQAPVHIHIAEQTGEVNDCLAHYGARPVQWLYTHFPVDTRWCLVHATHLDHSERQQLATSGAVAGLCISTEANLGDGFFPMREFMAENGCWGIGSDSHVSISVSEELRWLEYGVRLQYRERAVLGEAGQSCGEWLYRGALRGGARAAGIDAGVLKVGARADLVALDDNHPLLYGKTAAMLLDAYVFAGNAALVRDVWVGGHQVVSGGQHIHEEALRNAFLRAMKVLQG